MNILDRCFFGCGAIFFALCAAYPFSHIDLEEAAQDQGIVVETRQIIIKEYPHAFNPSIIRWRGSLLLSFRVIPDPARPFTSWLGLVWLDDDFQSVGPVQQLCMRSEQSLVPPRLEDGRLIAAGGRLYLVYSDNEDSVLGKGGFRMYVAELQVDGQAFVVKSVERLSSFEGNSEERREKNWVPFNYHGALLLAYSIVPHRIVRPLWGTHHCETFVSSESIINWDWGELRGGTGALLDGDHYLAFFHSSKRMVTAHSKGKEAMHYFMGAYTFSRELPFSITQLSKEPIIGKQFYNGADYKPYWGSVRVVFPCGFMADDDYIWVAYGRQDHEMWIAKLDKKKLYASLVPVAG